MHLEIGIYSTQLKHLILSQFEHISAQNSKKKVILVFTCDTGEALTMATETNYNDERHILAEAASMLRRKGLLKIVVNDSFSGSIALFHI